MKKAFANIPEGQVFYRTDGSGEPLLMLHPSPGSSEEYLKVIPLLTNNFQVFAMDTLGYGLSDDPPRDYDISDYARSVVRLLDALGINKISIVGHRTGAIIAVEVAVIYPDRVDNLVLSGCPTLDKSGWPAFIKQINAPPEHFANQFEIPNDDGTFLKDYWQRDKDRNPQITAKNRLKSICSRLLTYARPHNAVITVMNYDVKSRLPLIKCPTLVTAGSKDPASALLEITQILVPHSRIVVTPDASSRISREKPKDFADTIIEFLSHPGV